MNLARPDDLAAVPALVALLGGAGTQEPHEAARRVGAAEVAAHAQLLGIAAAALGSARGTRAPVRVERGEAASPREPAGLRIVDFSALWAGPCAPGCWARPGPGW